MCHPTGGWHIPAHCSKRNHGGGGATLGLVQVGLGDVELDRAVLDLAVAELADDLEDLGPGRVHPLVDLLVGLDGHHEFELLVGHLALLGGLAVVTAPAAGAAAALEAGVVAAVNSAAPL